MGSRNPAVTEAVRDICKKYPNASSISLARRLLADPTTFPLFKTLEGARSSVRFHRGIKPDGQGKEKSKDPIAYQLPTAIPPEFKIVDLPSGLLALVLSDIHIPYHDVRALGVAIDEGVRRGCNAVIYNGDVMDCYSLSTHEKDPRKPGIHVEREKTIELFGYVRQKIKPKRSFWKIGNHEDRLYRWLCLKAGELLGMPEMSWQSLCELDHFGIELVESPWIMRYEELTVLHGHEFGNGIFAPVNPARGAFLRTTDCVVMGHGHRTSHHVERTLRGRSISCWSTGCLCDLNPRYRPLNKWDHGAGILDTRTKDWQFSTFRIVNGKVCT